MNRLIMGMILVLGSIYFIGGYYSIASEEASKNTSLEASTAKMSQKAQTDLRHAIDQDIYLATEDGEKYYLRFEPENTGWSGAATFILPDGCEFVYGYNLSKNKISMTYIGNTCSAEGTNATMYIEDDGDITTILQGQKFVFSKD